MLECLSTSYSFLINKVVQSTTALGGHTIMDIEDFPSEQEKKIYGLKMTEQESISHRCMIMKYINYQDKNEPSLSDRLKVAKWEREDRMFKIVSRTAYGVGACALVYLLCSVVIIIMAL